MIVQARLGSSRLPGKILRPLGDKTLVEQVMSRLKKLGSLVDSYIVATSHDSYPSLRAIFQRDNDVRVFAGSEENVLERYVLASEKIGADLIVRATADNPFVSVGHVKSALKYHVEHKGDLTHYLGLPIGCGVEVISASALRFSYQHSEKPHQREHVTPYIYENPHHFRVLEPECSGIFKRPEVRLTIDEEADFKVAERVFDKLYRGNNDFPVSQILEIWDEESLGTLNQTVKQKVLV